MSEANIQLYQQENPIVQIAPAAEPEPEFDCYLEATFVSGGTQHVPATREDAEEVVRDYQNGEDVFFPVPLHPGIHGQINQEIWVMAIVPHGFFKTLEVVDRLPDQTTELQA